MSAAWRCPPCTGEAGGRCRCDDDASDHAQDGVAVVHYSIATYAGDVTVTGCLPDDDDEAIIARARRILTSRSAGSLPFGAESWRVVSRG